MFELGTKIKVLSGSNEGEFGVIMDYTEDAYDSNCDCPRVHIKLESGNTTIKYEDQLESIPGPIMEAVHQSINYGPAFKIGDVVRVQDKNDPTKKILVGIRECVEIIDGTNVSYEYNVSEISELTCDTLYSTYTENDMEYMYYDRQWNLYFMEGPSNNGLPPWRGDIYNFDMFKHIEGFRVELDKDLMNDYNDYTIPPIYMEHILKSHAIYYRIDSVLKHNYRSEYNRNEIRKALNLTDDDIDKLRRSIMNKIDRRNATDIDKNMIDTGESKHRKFTDLERKFVDQIDKLDVIGSVGEEKRKDHFPLDMTNIQIMYAIREAYHKATSVGRRRYQQNHDRRTGEVTHAVKGQKLYRGGYKINNKTKLIDFWYNFDLNLIETAYPTMFADRRKELGIKWTD